jgi:hypothetical protein
LTVISDGEQGKCCHLHACEIVADTSIWCDFEESTLQTKR